MDLSDSLEQLKQLREILPSSSEKNIPAQFEPKRIEIPRQIENIPPHKKSSAPYNFVPINEKVVWAENKDSKSYTFSNGFNTQSNTGYINLEIETLGDVFIGHKTGCPDFFSINDTLHIPGSSIRGLIRTYVEILSFGRFGCCDDRYLYFRTFASNSSVLRDLYNNRTKGEDLDSRICKYVKAGYLKKKGPAYFICPAQSKGKEDSQYERYNGAHSLDPFQWQKIKGEQYIIRSGPKFGRRKFEDTWLIYPPDKTACEIKLNNADIRSFRNDLKRGGDKDKKGLTDLIAQLDKPGSQGKQIPCFYVKDFNDKKEPIISFGHTKLFRLMYLHSLAQCLPSVHLETPESVDIAEAIFGRGEEDFTGQKISPLAGRVFFEDARACNAINPSRLSEKRLRLLAPNPTSVQHYLVQETTSRDNLNHYDSPNATLRGNKFYWHQNATYQTADFNDNLDNRIKPVKKETLFNGKLRFENLSKVELGALLSALQLPSGCDHKIGIGKSKGLGSIRIIPTLFLSDRQKRYTDLFGDLDTPLKTNVQNFCNAFNQYVLEQAGKKNVTNIWETYRLKQFRHLLTLHIAKKIEEQGVEEFKEKKLLHLPNDII